MYGLHRALQSFVLKVATLSDERLEELSSIRSFTDRLKFCNKHWEKLGAGSSRVVFDYNADSVLKLAKNKKGLEQNAVECDGFLQNYDVIPELREEDSSERWIVVEKVQKATESDFQSILGISWEDYCTYMRYQDERRSKNPKNPFEDKPEFKEKLDNDEFIGEIVDILVNFDMKVGDLIRISSYGKKNNKLKLIDAGLTKQVYDDYYKK